MNLLAPFLLSIWTRVVAVLPFRATQFVGKLIGQAAWVVRSQAASVTRTNIRHCFPALREHERTALAKRSLGHTGCLIAEAGMVFRWSPAKLETIITAVEGAALIESSLAVHRGVLLLAPHYGNWDLLALYLGRFAMTGLYDPPRIPSLEMPIRQARARTGSTLLPIDAPGLRGVYRSLQKGNLVAILPDQVPTRSAGTYAPFFGRPALTMTFAHRLIQSAKPLVVTGVAQRQGDGFRIRLQEVDEEVYAGDADVCVAAINRCIEKIVRADPAQYQWEYKRFKKPPPGNTSPYDD